MNKIFIYTQNGRVSSIKIKCHNMGDEESKDSLKKNFIWKLICKIFNVGHVLQPIWFRHYSILTGKVNREFVERKFNFVFYIGSLFWIIFILSKIFH